MGPFEVLAKTIWAEARGEGYRGMQAVANVITNRVDNPRWWGNSFESVCLKPLQFSCWNKDDDNYPKLLTDLKDDAAYHDAVVIADLAIKRGLEDITFNSDHYHAGPKPKWATEPVIVIGNHKFYRLELKEKKNV